MALRRLRESGNLPHAVLIIWSDAMRNAEGRSQSVNYRWNQMEITIEVDGRAAERPSGRVAPSIWNRHRPKPVAISRI